jgi:hypothetical protein
MRGTWMERWQKKWRLQYWTRKEKESRGLGCIDLEGGKFATNTYV